MVYLKSLSIKLISIYVSIFLVFSPLLGQTKREATIYMTNGYVGEVTVIEIGEEVVEVEIYQNGRLLKQNLQKSMIYQILLPGGEALYRNQDTKDIFEKAKRQEEQLVIQQKYEEGSNWNIRLMEGDSYLNVALWGMKGDSLVIGDMETKRTIYIGSIDKISVTKVKSNAGKFAKIGFYTGAIVGFTVGVLFGLECRKNSGEFCDPVVLTLLESF